MTTYDALPYDSNPFPACHPDRLAVVGRLFGRDPAPIETARVLELGCGRGGHLLPLAAFLPDARFLGIDLSRVQIEDARQWAERLELDNVRFEQADILELGPSLGTFDYVIAHGVYSWVPPEVQRRLLALTRQVLAPEGVALVSYNALPGWHQRRAVREAMLFHTSRLDQPVARVQQARAFLDLMAEHGEARSPGFRQGVAGLAEQLHKRSDTYLFHDFLAEHNEPLYLSTFVERASEAGLAYLGESELLAMHAAPLGEQVDEVLAPLRDDRLRYLQYLDFVANRSFHLSLLVRDDTAMDPAITADRVLALRVQSAVRPTDAVQLAPGVRARFADGDGAAVTTGRPDVKAALVHLGERWPGSVPVGALADHVCRALGRAHDTATPTEREHLAGALLQAHIHGAVELTTWDRPAAHHLEERPLALPIQRTMIAAGETAVPCLLHRKLQLRADQAALLAGADGSRTVDELAEALSAIDGAPETPEERRSAARDVLDELVGVGCFLRR